MPASYSPSDDAILGFPWNITSLSQRDVAIQIPLPYVNSLGVFLTAACFGHKKYKDEAAIRCISNLLAMGYKRFVIDVYWDVPRQVWSLCPVQLPSRNAAITVQAQSSSSDTASSQALSTASDSILGTSSSGASSAASTRFTLLERQAPSPTPGASSMTTSQTSSTTTSQTSSSATTTVSIISTVSSTNSTIYSSGPYTCSSTMTLSLATSLLEDFFDGTNTDVAALSKMLIFNMHAAASELDPTGPPARPADEDMPRDSNLLGRQVFQAVSGQLGAYMYRPGELRSERLDLNSSWLLASAQVQPAEEYNTIQKVSGDILTSPNGWPSESFLEFADLKRMIGTIGTVDAQMDAYDFESDSNIMFASQDGENLGLVRNAQIEQAPNGAILSGCFYLPVAQTSQRGNYSWQTSTELPNAPDATDFDVYQPNNVLLAVQNLTSCGISPMLNDTLLQASADQNPEPYKQFAYSAVWSWLPGQPALSNVEADFRCSVLDSTKQGRWVVRSCSERHTVACRADLNPYVWSISPSTTTYLDGDSLCPSGTSFAVPRTPIENRYLLAALQAASRNTSLMASSSSSHNLAVEPNMYGAGDLFLRASTPDSLVWINFNSIDVQSCWVIGTNETCPYDREEVDLSRTIVVPAVAAFVVIVLALLTLCAKCAGNRRELKRRRVFGKWEYEGVPS